MGIRSLLRNAFGRSKTTPQEPGPTRDATATREPATTIPEAREESTPPTPEPARPTSPNLPAQSTATTPHTLTSTPSVPAPSPEPAGEPADKSTGEPADKSTGEPTAAPTAEEAEEKAPTTPTPPRPKPAETSLPTPATATKPQPTATPEPQPTTPDTHPTATPEPQPEAQQQTHPIPAPAPAPTPVSLTKIETQAPGLVSLYKAAAVSLKKHGLATQRATVYLVLDRSGSMRPYYKDGTVQHLAEQALGLSANLDDDGTVPVVFFSTDIDGTADLDLTHYEGRIDELHAGLGHMGRTNYHRAISAVIEHYKKSGATDPAFVIFQTDGGPTSRPAAEKALCEAAKLPIFWQFIGFGDPNSRGFEFLRKLDELPVPEKRVIDNAGFFHAGQNPRSLTDTALYDQLMSEFPQWLTAARLSGILRG
ncbi:VWA domain-containing protein [Streptomyces sp. NPDC003077]|uniref:vWA domain-containing protein n=1 Tax=Streptomyces sp. NPDC003077 TaxID=3154443 RepID=UPI00339F990E